MKRLRILIADDHGMIRRGMRTVLDARHDWEVCGEATTGREALELAMLLRPDLIVLDLMMPELNGLEVTRKVRTQLPHVLILVQSMYESESLASEALAAGAKGYLLKSDAPEMLTHAIAALASGCVFFTPRILDVVSHCIPDSGAHRPNSLIPKSRLTPRERELVQLLAEGKSNKEAADLLSISVKTVETHRKNVISKLHLRSASDLVRYAIRERLIEP